LEPLTPSPRVVNSKCMKLGKWLGLAVAAVILAEGIWAILVSLTRSLLLPLLARVLGGDPHSPLYLGTGDLNLPDLFAAIIELCLAGILFLIIKAWAGKPDEVRISPAKKIAQTRPPVAAPSPTAQPAPVAPQTPAPASKPAAAAAAQTSTAPSPTPTAPVTSSPAPAQAQTAAPASPAQAPAAPRKSTEKPAGPSKPAKPREVYYNLVGEPINPTEDE